ncbi:MAG: hypothetical protein WCV41_03080 [Patescibacteria group bacterium]
MKEFVLFIIAVILIFILVKLVRKRNKKIFRQRIAKCFEIFDSASANALRDNFIVNKWRVPGNFNNLLAEMLEEGLVMHSNPNKSKRLLYKLTEAGENILPKPKPVETVKPPEPVIYPIGDEPPKNK